MTKTAPRRRRVVHFDATRFETQLDNCLKLEVERQRRNERLTLRGQVLPWFEEQDLTLPSTPQFLQQHLLAMLKAFADAARPAGGLEVDEQGLPIDAPGLVAAGRRLSLAAGGPPRVVRNIQAGQPVDWRLAQAMLCFFRVFLERPQLCLDDLGAHEPAQLLSAHLLGMTVEKARALLPQSALQGLLTKTGEVSAHAWMWIDYEREYRSLQLAMDQRGVPRVTMERTTRYYPLKLADFDRPLRPGMSYEWFEWARFTEARLSLRHFDLGGHCKGIWHLALRKRLDERLGIIVIEMAPEQPAEVLRLLDDFSRAKAGEHGLCQLEWRERLTMNAADRDTIVCYRPIASLKISIDPGSMREFACSVGDSPGLVERPACWQLERALLPREVLEVRMRWRGLRGEDVMRVSPSGEMLADLGLRPGHPAFSASR